MKQTIQKIIDKRFKEYHPVHWSDPTWKLTDPNDIMAESTGRLELFWKNWWGITKAIPMFLLDILALIGAKSGNEAP